MIAIPILLRVLFGQINGGSIFIRVDSTLAKIRQSQIHREKRSAHL